MKFLILLLILAFLSPAHAQMSCVDLFSTQKVRPSEEQIDITIQELHSLLSMRHTNDSHLKFVAHAESQRVLRQLEQHLSKKEISDRLKKVKKSESIERSIEILDNSELIQKIEDSGLVSNYLSKHKYPNINAFTGQRTIVQMAVKEGQNEVLAALIREKANIHVNSPVLLAARTNNLEALKILVQAGAKVNTYDGTTPLTHAITLRNKEMVQFLLENNVDVNLRDSLQNTPLMWARRNMPNDPGNKIGNEIVELLEQAGATK